MKKKQYIAILSMELVEAILSDKPISEIKKLAVELEKQLKTA